MATCTADRSRWAEAVAVKGGNIVYVGQRGAQAKRGTVQRNRPRWTAAASGALRTHNHVNGRAQAVLGDPRQQLSPHAGGLSADRSGFPGETSGLKAARQGFDGNILPAIRRSRKRQPRQLLDDIVSDLKHTSNLDWPPRLGHQSARARGRTKDTRSARRGARKSIDPATGEPNGIVHENGAMNLIVYKLPEPDMTVEQYRAGILSLSTRVAPPRGIPLNTGATDSRAENLDTAMQQLR
jgi:hypothetical protein